MNGRRHATSFSRRPTHRAQGRGEEGTRCLLQPVDVSNIGHSGQAMTWSSITGDNVPPRVQSRIDTASKLLACLRSCLA